MTRQIEMAVLGLIFHDKSNLDRARDVGLKALSFNEIDLKAVFEQIERRELSGDNWSAETLSSSMGGTFPLVLADALASAPVGQNVEYFARELVTLSWKESATRSLMTVLGLLRTSRPFEPVDHIREQAYQAMNSLVEQSSSVSSWEPTDLANVYMDHIETVIAEKKEGKTPGIRTGFENLDKIIPGWLPDTFNVIGARTSVGKTTMALNFAVNAALSGHQVAYFTIEMKAQSLLTKILSNLGRVVGTRISRGDVDENELDRMYAAIKKFAVSGLRLNDKAGRSIETIEAEAWRLKRSKKLDLLFIDYVQQLHCTSKRFTSRQAEITEITGRLQSLSQRLSIPVVVLAQLNREAERLPDGEMPNKSHLKDSGSIEQDADIILIIHRVQMEDAESPTWICVEKNRNGQLGSVEVKADLKFNRFGGQK
jgi:replicative DNA helicase